MKYQDVTEILKSLADEEYRKFSGKITKTRLPFYGVRTPDLRKLARRICAEYPEFGEDFFARREYSHEEVLLCGMSLGKDYRKNVDRLKRLIPRMDCWAHVDQVVNHLSWVKDVRAFLSEFEYLKSGGEFEARAYVMMMFGLCVNERYLPVICRELPTLPQGMFYTDMAVAWLLCEVVVKFYDCGIKLLTEPFVTDWVRRKAISKCRDSFRLTQEQKDFLATLR